MSGRVGRFVRAARSLLLMQLAAALLAVALAVWAVFSVRDLAAERDRLRAQVAALEARPPGPSLSTAVGPPQQTPLDTEVRPPPILPIPVPIPVAPETTNMMLPGDLPPAAGGEQAPVVPPPAATNQNRPRPGRWSPPVIKPQTPPAQPQPSGAGEGKDQRQN